LDHQKRAVELLTYYLRGAWEAGYPNLPLGKLEERDISDIVEHIIEAAVARAAEQISHTAPKEES
jgi:hypothetical protein